MTCLCVTFQSFGQILSGYLAPVIAGIVGYIAYQQYILAKRKLNLDLFDKRFKVYLNIKNFIHEMLTDNNKKIEDIHTFKFSILEIEFLFRSDIKDYVELIIKNSYRLQNINKTRNDNALDIHSEEFKKEYEEGKKLSEWFRNEQESIASKFMKYLDFRNL